LKEAINGGRMYIYADIGAALMGEWWPNWWWRALGLRESQPKSSSLSTPNREEDFNELKLTP
jgi:hypothetical protein